MTKNFSIAFIFYMALFGACSQKTSQFSSDKAMEEFHPEYFDFEYLTAKARIVIEEPNGKSTKGTFHLRAKKDSVVWFSMTPGLGIEALRGIITEDRIRVKDRISHQDIDMMFEEFEEKYGIKISLQLFQNLLFANIPFEFAFKDRLLRVGRHFELTQVKDDVRYFTKINTRHGKVEELSSLSLNEKGALMASYQNFKNIDDQPFPKKILLKLSFKNLEDQQTSHSIVQIEMNKIETHHTELSFPFRN
jgi:hypothetical protein